MRYLSPAGTAARSLRPEDRGREPRALGQAGPLGATWCSVVYSSAMPTVQRVVRQSVSLPPAVARRVKSLAKSNRTSASRILVELIESGLEARELEKKHFLTLADRLSQAQDPEEQSQLKEELARLTFGE